ncbi:MAG: ABC transporter permease subunit [Clostridia bacterium]|nr:ABC transporter permease subunit [Clostridia bacterium]
MLNPVLRREAKTSLRNWKIFYAVAGYILVVTAVAAIAIWQIMYNSYSPSFDPTEMVNVYIGLTVLQLFLVLLMTPAFTAGSISGERERQTLDLLLVTKMSPLSIVVGKFLSGLSLIVLMVVATMPIFALVMYFGGTSLPYILAVTGYMILICGAFGAIAIFFSTVFKKTVTSMVITYIWTGILCGATIVLYAIVCSVYGSYYQASLPTVLRIAMLAINPAVGLISIVCEQTGNSLMYEILNYNNYYGQTFTPVTTGIPMWVINAIALVIIIAVFLLAAAFRLRKISKKG